MKLFEIKNKTPKWMILEDIEGKNVHLEHLEDEIFNRGWQGAQSSLNYLDSLRAMLAEGTGTTTQVTVKWDGSPAIICGIDPADGKFFVGTKSVFAKTEPKLCKTNKNIDEWYAADKPQLAEKLAMALKYLPKLGIGGVVQGDLMFTPGDLSTVEINNEDCYVFTPNTITYAVPVASELGKRISQAKIGIIFHTSYQGDSVLDMTASFGVNVAGFNQVKDVWFDDATYKDLTGIASLKPTENSTIRRGLAAAAATMQKLGQARFDSVLSNKEFSAYIKPFINSKIRAGEQVGEPTKFLQEFMAFYQQKMLQDVSDPTSRKAQNRLAKVKEKEQWIADNSNNLLGVLAVYKRIIELKLMLIAKLQQVESIGTFQKTETGYKVTAPEGFVAIGHDGGAVKLVDRLAFSRTNFLRRA